MTLLRGAISYQPKSDWDPALVDTMRTICPYVGSSVATSNYKNNKLNFVLIFSNNCTEYTEYTKTQTLFKMLAENLPGNHVENNLGCFSVISQTQNRQCLRFSSCLSHKNIMIMWCIFTATNDVDNTKTLYWVSSR